MKTHASFGLPTELLDIVVVEDSRPMQTILRSILFACSVARIRMFDSAEEALQSMLAEPPNMIITDYRMSPMNGYQLLRSIRNRNMAPLCYVPVIMITAHGTRSVVEKAYRGGAQCVLVKPISPSVLQKRLDWISRDSRPFEYDETGHCVIRGVEAILDQHQERFETLNQAREYHDLMTRQVTQIQDEVDEVFKSVEADPEDAVLDTADQPVQTDTDAPAYAPVREPAPDPAPEKDPEPAVEPAAASEAEPEDAPESGAKKRPVRLGGFARIRSHSERSNIRKRGAKRQPAAR
ncbi:MAG: response regulator [Pseudomonadota bacterium]